MSLHHKDAKAIRKIWLDYMKKRFSQIHGAFNPNVHTIRDDGSVTTGKNAQGNMWTYEDVGVDYRTFKLKYRATGIQVVPSKLGGDEE